MTITPTKPLVSPTWPVHGISRDEFLRLLRINAAGEYDTAVILFRNSTSVDAWQRLLRAMYVLQATQQFYSGTLEEDLLLRHLADQPIGLWTKIVHDYVQQRVADM
jgi:hypothetical protein